MPKPVLSSQCARFHLKDGRTLVFKTIPRSLLRRRAPEIALALLVAVLGLLAAELFAKGLGRSDARAARPTREAAAVSER